MTYTHPIGTRWETVKTDAFQAGVTLIQEDGYVQIIGELGKIGRLERHPSFDPDRMVLPTWTRVGNASANKHTMVDSIQVGDRVTIRETSEYWEADSKSNPRYVVGTVEDISRRRDFSRSVVTVIWDNDFPNSYSPHDLKVVAAQSVRKEEVPILKRFHEACELIGNYTGSTHCHYAVFSSENTEKLKTINGACHASVKNNRTPDRLFVITRIDKRCIKNRRCSLDDAIYYYDWLFNRSPLRHAFLTKNASRAVRLGYAVTRARVGSNYMQVANVALRQPWEVHNTNVRMFRRYVEEAGLPENAAWVLAEYADAEMTGLRYHLGNGGHRMFDFHAHGTEATRRFIQDDLLPAKESYREDSDYSGTDLLVAKKLSGSSTTLSFKRFGDPVVGSEEAVKDDTYVNIFIVAIEKESKKVRALTVEDRINWASSNSTAICDYLIGEEV